jgi:hypothetical protein
MAAAAEAAFVVMAKHFITTADEMGKMAQKAGVTVEVFSDMAYVGDLAGASTETLKNSFKKLNEQIVSSNQGSPEALQLFRDLGITAKDGAGAMLQLADKFASTADGAGKTAAAVKLLGKSGDEMIPFLNQGSDAIRELMEESKLFGHEISGGTAKSAEEFNDNMTRMGKIIQGVVNEVMSQLLPSMAEYSAWLIKVIKENGIVQGSVSTLIDVFKVLKFVLDSIVYTVKLVYDAFVLLGNYIGSAVSAWIDGLKIFGGALQDIGAIIKAVFSGDFSDARVLFDGLLSHLKSNFENFKSGLFSIGQGVKADWEKLWKDMANGPAAPLLFQGPTIGAPKVEPIAPLKQQLQLNSTQTENKSVNNNDAIKAFELERQMQQEQLSGIAALVAEEENRYERRLTQIGKLNLEEEDALRVSEIANKAHTEAIRKMYAQNLAQGVSTAFGNMAAAAQAFGKKGFAAFKAFATAQALVNTYSSAVAAYNAMAGIPFVGPALAVAAAAAAIAAGIGNVAQIQSTNPPGQAHAGLTYVPAEQTYVLSQGERVLAPKQNEDFTNFIANQGGNGQSNPTVLAVSINMDGRELYRGIHDASRNGTLTIDPRAIREGI